LLLFLGPAERHIIGLIGVGLMRLGVFLEARFARWRPQ